MSLNFSIGIGCSCPFQWLHMKTQHCEVQKAAMPARVIWVKTGFKPLSETLASPPRNGCAHALGPCCHGWGCRVTHAASHCPGSWTDGCLRTLQVHSPAPGFLPLSVLHGSEFIHTLRGSGRTGRRHERFQWPWLASRTGSGWVLNC